MANYTMTVGLAKEPDLTTYAKQPGQWTVSLSGAATASQTVDTLPAIFTNCPAGSYTISIARLATDGTTLLTQTNTYTLVDGTQAEPVYLGLGTPFVKLT